VVVVGSERRRGQSDHGGLKGHVESISRGIEVANAQADQAGLASVNLRWHRAGFRRYWRWKSRSTGGRPPIHAELRALIRQMSVDNPLWGAPRIHGELLKLGFEVAQSSVAKYIIRRPPPLRRDGLPSFASLDANRRHGPVRGSERRAFELLYVFIIVRVARRELIWINVTSRPTAEWIIRQITEAFPWNEAPRYLIRDRYRNAA
jgi:hypothetical protein